MSIGARDTRGLLLSTAAAALVGCEVSPTQLVVVVDTNMAVPGVLDGFRTRVTRAGREDGDVRRFTLLAESSADALPARLPASFGVAPRDGDARVTVDVIVEALRGDEVLFETRALTGFVERHALRLDMFLAQRCVVEHLDCDSDETCTIDGCVPPFIDPGALPEFDGLDAGGIVDAGTDAAAPDAAPDAALDAAPDSGTAPPEDFAVLIAETDGLPLTPAFVRAADDALYVVVGIDDLVEVVGAGSFWPAGADDRDALLLRYDTSGRLQTSAQLGAAGASVTVRAATLDGEDGLLVGGGYGGAPNLDGTVLPEAALPEGTAFVARFHGADLSLDWVRTYPSSLGAAVWTVAADPVGGGVAIGGNFDDDIDLGGAIAAPRTAFFALLDPLDREVECRIIVGGVTSAIVEDVRFDPTGRALVSGRFAGIADLGDGQLFDPGGGGRAGFLARYSPGCVLEDVALATGIVGAMRAASVNGGGTQVLGQVIGNLAIDDASFPGSGTFDIFASSFDEQLSHVGTTMIGGSDRDEPLDLAGRDGAPPVAGGWVRDDASFGDEVVSSVSIDGFVTALGPNGFPSWVEPVTGEGDQEVFSVAWHATALFVYALGATDGSAEVGPALLEPRLARGIFLYGFAAPPGAE